MVLAGAAILVVIGGTVFVSGKRPKDEKGSGISENIGVDSDELLTLVNAEHPMPSEWQCELVQLNNGQNIDSRAYEDLQQMMDTARAEGYDPYICSSWRSHETQVRLFEEEIQSYKKQGYSEREAEVQAAQWVAVPGTSEHELGLALDIVSVENQRLEESQENTPTQQWLMEHCYEYGFILRYPKDKEDITGIGYEPWHYRYVGQDHARAIHESGVCLEEYVAHR
ncbi:MAG TPA: D-alanyl-D-alanine carboxypeptidase [Lachnospiraceae bacterium]|nr:M15 family metallopeptidase [Frisingicoccus caecimuris]HAP19647.1 D-alanyl-D-alanine carboxypeptidase [Lachnospiraceae bacterium]